MKETLKIFNLNHSFKSLLFLLLFALQVNAVFAQGFTVNGTVFGSAKDPIPGVTIIIDGTTTGAITDMDGKYSIKVPNKEALLVYQFMGYKTQEIVVGDKTTLNVELEEDAISVDEVVVVGYGVQKKESVVGAISQVKGESLVESGMSNITNAIAGKLSGVFTMQTTGQPGSDSAGTILIRGASSWNGSSPLVLVDGVERDFKDMDPNEVETLSVLKDASATAVFGAKGANGVIIITTKRGKTGAPKLDVSASVGLKKSAVDLEHVDAYTTMSLYNYGQMNQGNFQGLKSEWELEQYKNPSSPLNSILYPDVNWYDLLMYDFASETNANVNVTGGTDFVKYFATLGYVHDSPLFKGLNNDQIDTRYKNDRINYRANLDFKLTKSTQLSFNLGGSLQIQNQPSDAVIWDTMNHASTTKTPAVYPSWLLEMYPDTDYPNDKAERIAYCTDAMGGPYQRLYQGKFNQNTTSTLFTDLVLKQDLSSITEGLSVQGKVSLSTSYQNKSLTASWGLPIYEFFPERQEDGLNPWVRDGQGDDIWHQGPLDVNVGSMTGSYYLNLYYEGSVNYNRSFGDHTVSGLLLVNRSQKNSGSSFPYYNEAWVARATYDYAGKYLFEVNLGYTGSEKFAPSNRFGFFPSFALGYVVSNEKWFKDNVNWMNKLKLRYSDGKVGSDSGSRWLYMSDFSYDSGYIKEGSVANTSAQWEEAQKRDIGIELAMFDNQFYINADFFDEQRSKMLLTPQTTTFLIGNNGFKQINAGALKKHGVEVEAGFRRTTSYGLQFNIDGMFGYNENRILAKDDLPFAPEYVRSAGKSHGGQMLGSVTTGTGYYTSIDEIHNYVRPISITALNVGDLRYLDYDGNGKVDKEDRYPIEGSTYAPITYSFGGGLNYKNFSLNILFQGNEGKYATLNKGYAYEFTQGAWRVHQASLDYWAPTNTDATHPTIHYYDNTADPNIAWAGGGSQSGYSTKTEGFSWVKADYLKLREVYLSYMFDTKKLKQSLGVSNLTVYASGNNLCTFTSLVEGDPESDSFYNGAYPQMATVKLGVKLGF